MMLFYGPNRNKTNNSCFENAEYDAAYQASQKMPDSPERDKLYQKMARLLEVNAGLRIGYARYRNMLAQPKVMGYKKHPIFYTEWMYVDIDKTK
jgi:ABC-type transport system substrate-binding protein